MTEAGAAPGFWSCRTLHPDGSTAACTLVQSDLHPDRSRIALPQAQARDAIGRHAMCSAHFDGCDITSLELADHIAPNGTAMWFAELGENDARPPASHLLAFSGHGAATGKLLDRVALREVGVTTADQLAAIRVYPGTGEVDQVYVSPMHRRRGIGPALIVAAATLAEARGWGSMWSDGQRTTDGDRMVRAKRGWSHRAAELTHLAPPMTPLAER